MNDNINTTLLNLSGVIEDIFMVLTDKEKEIIVRRFSLNNRTKETLESIGKSFSVTRERIRQIEESALKKLRRTLDNTQLQGVVELSAEILEKNDGLMSEKNLISKLIRYTNQGEIDGHIIKLALTIDENILSVKLKKGNELLDAWRSERVSEKNIRAALDALHKTLKKEKDVCSEKELISKAKKFMTTDLSSQFLRSALTISTNFKETDKGWGLTEWRHINPKSIRDKSYVILKQNSKDPMHFVEITNKIIESSFDKKAVTVQAVHNELIRNTMFVLVGRGLYALREWGVTDGTVSDVIADILKNAKEPMHKNEIVEAVLGRRVVKQGTIALNLQKNPHFVRVGRAVYEYKE